VHLPDRVAVAVAAIRTNHRATSLAPHAVVHGLLAHVVVAASAAASMTVLLLVPAALSAVQRLIQLPFAAPATRPQRHIRAQCVSVTI